MPFNLFRRKKKEDAKRETGQKLEAREEKKARVKVFLPGVLRNPHVTEKAGLGAEKGNYVFRVHPQANKGLVRQAVESLYGVQVQSVHLTRKPAKRVRIGRRQRVKPGLKKAVVQLKAGQTIETISR